MNNDLYSGMLNGLSKVNLTGFDRAQAQLHLHRAAVLVEMILGSGAEKSTGGSVKVEPTIAHQPEQYRKAA